MSDGVDPVTLEVTRNAAEAVCEEMNATLVRTGYSPNIKERRDCSCALFDADAEMIAQAETLPVHLGAMPFSVRAAIDRFPPATLEPGDSILLNDPFRGGAHLPDFTLVTPIFEDGRDRDEPVDGRDRDERMAGEATADSDPGTADLVAFAANRAHHADVGGAGAGSIAADARDIYAEGLRIPPVKLYAGGDRDEGLFETILANVRTPDERRGDLRAQQAANQTGRRRFQDLLETHGRSTLDAAFEEIKDYAERRMRAAIESIPDGTYEFADVLDDDGAGNRDLPIEVAVTVDGDAVHVDFAGTAPQTDGPVNAVFAVTASATYYCLRCVTDPDIPPNHGCYRPITIDAPAGSIVNPDPPAAVVGGNVETSQRITDVVLGALAEAVPDRVVAGSQGTMNNVALGGTDPRDGSPYAFYETQGGGLGGRAGADGMDAVHVHMSNTLNTPVEVLETAYPLRVTEYSLRPDSGGAGEFRGGLGLRRDVQVRDHEATCNLLADRHDNPPYGLIGGQPGETGETVRIDPDGTRETIAGKSAHRLSPGTILSIRTPGGGGYGDPADRDPARIERDLERGTVTPEAVRADYGPALDEEVDLGIDPDGGAGGGVDADAGDGEGR